MLQATRRGQGAKEGATRGGAAGQDRCRFGQALGFLYIFHRRNYALCISVPRPAPLLPRAAGDCHDNVAPLPGCLPQPHLLREAQAAPQLGTCASLQTPAVVPDIAEDVGPLMPAPVRYEEDARGIPVGSLPDGLDVPIDERILRMEICSVLLRTCIEGRAPERQRCQGAREELHGGASAQSRTRTGGGSNSKAMPRTLSKRS
mmetsp:Transcript_90476/g.194079  ORF Transcript_90476/g.194079 Transcript_90476/m.194079 type:complete len:203 (+) Transcript_90476:584-1192(+)